MGLIQFKQSAARNCVIVGAALGSAFLAGWLFDPFLQNNSACLFFLAATAFVAWTAGLFPALVALGLGLVLSNWVQPHSSLLPSADNWVTNLGYSFVGLAIAWLSKNHGEDRRQTARRALEVQSKVQALEKELAARMADLTDARQQLESFAYSASHDLRAPLRAVKGFTLALREDYGHLFNDEGKDYAQRIVDGVEHMEQLLAALLAYSRIGRGEIPLVKVELEEYLAKLSQQWAADFQARGARLEIARPLPAVTANPLLLDQALAQLISNALKFVPPGTVPQVQLQTEELNGAIRLKVADNGIGIDPKNHVKLFQVFQRFQPAEKYPGLGIGLAIARKAVERMGGRVGLDPQSPQGSCFWIELPKVP
jgi:signal transduction histidine kinase